MMRLLLALLPFLWASIASADGGRLRMKEAAGPFIVTLFTAPDPLLEGPADFSVAIERQNLEGLVENADVTFILTPEEGVGDRLVLHASHGAATSKFLQAANFSFPHAGRWRITVMVREGSRVGQCSGEIDVRASYLPGEQLAWEIAVVPLAVLFFLAHQWRKRRATETIARAGRDFSPSRTMPGLHNHDANGLGK